MKVLRSFYHNFQKPAFKPALLICLLKLPQQPSDEFEDVILIAGAYIDDKNHVPKTTAKSLKTKTTYGFITRLVGQL